MVMTTRPNCAKPLVDPPFHFAGRRVNAIKQIAGISFSTLIYLKILSYISNF